LVVIGADSGVGKSSLVVDISRHNAKSGKKVGLFYLEGGHIEAIRRMKWQDICEEYYSTRDYKQFRELDYRKWSLNSGDKLTDLTAKVYDKNKELYKDNLFFYPITADLKIEELLDSLLEFHKLTPSKFGPFDKNCGYDLDLIVIDHLQYFSLDKADNEIVEITRIIRECKKITDHYNIPVILVSHCARKAKTGDYQTKKISTAQAISPR